MAITFQVTLDSVDPHAQADWWAETLGWQVEPQDEAFIRRMIDAGYTTEEETTTHRGQLVWRTGAALNPPEPGMPRVLFQWVPEPRTVKNRMHLDLRLGRSGTGSDAGSDTGPDVERVVAELTARGATRLHDGQQGPSRWVTMADPEGNEFCVSP